VGKITSHEGSPWERKKRHVAKGGSGRVPIVVGWV